MLEDAKPTCSTEFFLGVDGGGTGTEACVTNAEGTVLGRGHGGPSNINYVPEDIFVSSISAAVCEALIEAQVHVKDLSGACLALAGAGGENPEEIHRVAFPILYPCPFFVVEDTYSALAAAHEGRDGIVVIAGTGSNCLGVKDGRYASTGGYGALLGDEGSAYNISVQGLRAALRSFDGRQGPTSLTDLFLATTGARTPRDFVSITLELDRPSIAALSKVVFEAAGAGDETALSILEAESDQLAEMVKAVATRLGLNVPKVAAKGGCFKNSRYLNGLSEQLRRILPEANLVDAPRPAAEGASILAIQHFAKGTGSI